MTTATRSKLIGEWSPSDAALDLVKLNGVTEAQVVKAIERVGQ